MPFLLVGFAIVYYSPYIAFRVINKDLISLKDNLKKRVTDHEAIAKSYFNLRVNSEESGYLRIVLNIFIKISYIAVNLMALFTLNFSLNDEYLSHGINWVNWSRLNNSLQFDYLGTRDHPKPGKQY